MKNDDYKRILAIIVATSIVMSTIIMMNSNKSKDEAELANISEEILDTKELGPNKLMLFLDRNLTDEEKEEILEKKIFNKEVLDNLKKESKEENILYLRKKD